ncbi:alpha/beta hydrolase [Thermaurantiacus sp.]
MPPLLLVHGMWSRPSAFTTLIAELSAAGIQCRAPALPFHDLSPGAPAPPALARLSLEDYVAAIAKEAAACPSPPVLLGHSLGGLIVQKVAADVGAAGLILLATAPSATALVPSLAQAKTLRRIMLSWGWWKRPTILDATSALAGVFNGVPEAEARAAVAELTWDSGRVLAQISAPFLDRAQASLVDYARLTMPALVIFGLQDRIATAGTSRATARQLRGSVDYEEWADCGHWFFHDACRPRLAQAIARFMGSLGS